MNIYLYHHLMATGVVVLHILLVLLLFFTLSKKIKGIKIHLQQYGLWYGLILSFITMVGSIGFSEIFNYPPCKLCWIQRIFHFPQVILFTLALLYRDTRVWMYILWLSIIGFVISLYHFIIELNPALSIATLCGSESSVSCSNILTQSYGYITIPVMSGTLFLVMIILAVLQQKKK